MAQPIHKNRNGCSLHGAIKTLDAINGFVSIVHSNAGCSIQSKLSENGLSSSGNSIHRWLEVPCTNIIEKQVVFGGTSRLREQIKNTVKVMNADLFVVVTGCAPEVVGDDVPAMVKEAREQGFPVISASTPGFKGSIHKGHELVVKAILDQLPTIQKQVPKPGQPFVNIWGIIPCQDVFWDGTLTEIERILSEAGFKSNRLFGQGAGLNSWTNIPHAALNLSLSPWGFEITRHLHEKYDTPYLNFGWVPVGADDTSWLLTLLSLKLNIDPDTIIDIRRREESKVKFQLQKLSETYFAYDFQKEVALVGDTAIVTGLARFLQETFGQLVKTIILTDSPAEELREGIIKSLISRNGSFSEIVFLSDSKEIDDLLLQNRPEVILGSSLEKSVSQRLNIPLITVSTPVFDRFILSRHYAGYSGAVSLVEDFSERLLRHQQEMYEKKYQQTSVTVSKTEEENSVELSLK